MFFPYIGNSNPNWLIFFRGVGSTTNQHNLGIETTLIIPDPQLPSIFQAFFFRMVILRGEQSWTGLDFMKSWVNITMYRSNIPLTSTSTSQSYHTMNIPFESHIRLRFRHRPLIPSSSAIRLRSPSPNRRRSLGWAHFWSLDRCEENTDISKAMERERDRWMDGWMDR